MEQQRPGGTERHRRADAERSIEAILDATIACAPHDGNFNMTTIARAAGVSRVTLYAHFPTREALIDAAMRRAIGRTGDVLSKLPLEDGQPVQVLTDLVRSSWQVLADHGNLYAVASVALPPEELRAYTEPVMSRVGNLIARGQAEGAFSADLPREWLVDAFYGLMHLAADQVTSGHVTADQAGELVTASVLSLLRAKHPSAA